MVILGFEGRFTKQNSAIRLKSNILASPQFFPPKFFGLATPLVSTHTLGTTGVDQLTNSCVGLQRPLVQSRAGNIRLWLRFRKCTIIFTLCLAFPNLQNWFGNYL